MTTAIVDEKKRVRLPTAKPGQVFSIEPNPDGSFVLLPVRAAERQPMFPKGSLLKYLTPERDAEQLAILKGCVEGPIGDE